MSQENPRSLSRLREDLQPDPFHWAYRYLWVPLLLLQSGLYSRVVWRFWAAPVYASVPTETYPLLHQNHIGNLVSLERQPDLRLLGIHVAMAWSWIVFTLIQKRLGLAMGAALRGDNTMKFDRIRRFHRMGGWFMGILGLVGIGVTPIFTFLDHGNPAMKLFLLGQPLFFLPAIAMTLWTARDRRRPIWDHRFWAETAFVGPAVASVWTEGAIYVTGRMTEMGPNAGEVWSSAVGGTLGALVVVGPAWVARRRAQLATAAREAPR